MALRRNAIHALVGNGFFSATQLLILIALTRFTSPETVGSYALALAIAAPAYFLGNLRLRQMAITDTVAEFSFSQYVTGRLAATVLVWIFIAIPSLIFGDKPNWILILVSTIKALDNVSDILYAAPHKNGRLDQVSRFLIARGTFSAGVLAVLLWQNRPLVWALTGVVVVYLISNFLEWRLAKKHETFRITLSRPGLRPLFRISLPLGFAMAASSFNTMLPRYALQFSDGTEAVALFSTAAYLLVLGGLVMNSLAQAAAPELASGLKTGGVMAIKPTINRLRGIALLLALLSVIIAALAGGPVMGLIFGGYYAQADTVLILLCVSTIATYQSGFLGTLLNVYRRFEAPLPITVATLATTAVLSIPLTLTWGANGAALAVIAGAIAEFVVHVAFVKRGPITRR